MNKRLILNLSGTVLLTEAALMLLTYVVTLFLDQNDHWAMILSTALTGAAGLGLHFVKPKRENLRARDGFAAVALSWILVSAFGALPFFLSGAIPNYIDALFESVSGFTTTGATILTDVEAMPKGLLLWRSFTHWAGGMGVLVLSLAIMPRMGSRSIHLMRAESPGPSVEKLVPRVGKTAKILYRIYLVLTVIMFAVLLLCGLNWYDALVHTFGTAGTGGFSIYANGIAHYTSPLVQVVIAVFCMLFGINFALYYALIRGDFKTLLRNGELKLYLAIVAIATALITLNILPQYGGKVGDSLRHAYFQVCSIISSTGFASTDFNLWPQLSRTILVVLMVLGCCAGSTGGGLKLIRLELLSKAMIRDVRRTISPRSVTLIKLDGRPVEEETVSSVQGYFFTYMLIAFISALLVSCDSFVRDVSFETCFTSAITTLSNIGPGLDAVGPMGSFAGFTPFSKIVLTLNMIVGRLELFPMLMFFSHRAWQK